MCRFAIAVQRPYSSQDGERQADFFECTAWRGLGETIARYTKKGKKVAVAGSVQIRNYEDNQGAKRTAVDIIVQDCEFLTPKTGDSFDEVSEAPRASAKKKPALQAMDDDSDIPF
jgi:single-strand DNA-binding protein